MDQETASIGLNALLAVRLTKILRASNFPMEAAVWVWFPEKEKYYFVIVSNYVDTIGTKESYKKIIQLIIDKEGSYQPYGGWVNLVSPTDPVAKSIQAGHYEGLNFATAELDM